MADSDLVVQASRRVNIVDQEIRGDELLDAGEGTSVY